MQSNSGGADLPHVLSGNELSSAAAATPTAASAGAFGARQLPNGAMSAQLLNTADPAIKADILKMIVQYLEKERLFNAAAVLQDEANMKAVDVHAKRAQSSRLRKAIFDGDWEAATKFITRIASPAEQKKLQYYLHRQEYLELIDRQEFQRAFGVLTKRLKPLEDIANASAPTEFQELCYLLTCSSVHDTKLFKDWGSIAAGRENLADRVAMAVDLSFAASAGTTPVPPDRLVTLLHQAATYQVEHCFPKPSVAPTLSTLLEDFQPIVLPNATMRICVANESSDTTSSARSITTSDDSPKHSNGWTTLRASSQGPSWRRSYSSIKCAEFISDAHDVFPVVVGGGTDGGVYFWWLGSKPVRRGAADKACDTWPAVLRLLEEDSLRSHNLEDAGNDAVTSTPSIAFAASGSTVWDLCSTRAGDVLITASGDGNVAAWRIRHAGQSKASSMVDDAPYTVHSSLAIPGEHRARLEILCYQLGNHTRDAYCVAMHPDNTHVASGGYDRVVHLYSLKSGEEIKTCTGHTAPVTQVAFNPFGNLVISSSRDGTIRFWDCLSGVCVRTIEEPLGEITSVNMTSDGSALLACARFGTARILDARAGNTLTRFMGHGSLSTSSMYRPAFAAKEQVVISGSDDGVIVAWDAKTGQAARKLVGHAGPVTRIAWYAPISLIASVSLDGTLRVWHWDSTQETTESSEPSQCH